jgi:hypothetical protein
LKLVKPNGEEATFFHWIIVIAASVVGAWSIWEDGLISQGKNHPNFSAHGMALIILIQLTQIYSYRKNYRK